MSEDKVKDEVTPRCCCFCLCVHESVTLARWRGRDGLFPLCPPCGRYLGPSTTDLADERMDASTARDARKNAPRRRLVAGEVIREARMYFVRGAEGRPLIKCR